MKILVLACLAALFTGCNSSSAYGKKLADSDSLVIQFTDTLSGKVIKSMQATAAPAIKKLSRFVDSKAVEVYKCGYDGNMKFYKGGVVNGEVSFQFNKPGCRHFLYMEGNQLTSTAMSNEAADFLRGMVEGRTWY